jgi:hypothetical protein
MSQRQTPYPTVAGGAIPILVPAWQCHCACCGHEWTAHCECLPFSGDLVSPFPVATLAHQESCAPPARCPKCGALNWTRAARG